MLLRPRYRIRPATRGDIHILPKIERAAGSRFAPYGLVELFAAVHTAVEQLEDRQARGQLWVAADRENRPVGFAAASILDGCGHLDELDVLPRHGRNGLGTRLLDQVCVWAWRQACPGVTLSTMRDVPWNAPFYRSRGFHDVPAESLTEGLVRLQQAEATAGLPVERRVIMRRVF
jgi:GNAT superfamily N-acetyltransferase